MDIYQLVGTLLLTFCMSWYTDSAIWQLPVWYSDLWLISNFAAIGYLIMGVWLAMYASVAARSIGTRLLTSYSRIAFPYKSEIDAIKYPIFGNAGVGDAVRKAYHRATRQKEPATSADASKSSKTVAEVEEGEDMVLCEDDSQHFNKFLDELPKWLVHDTWSRVCMSYGLNQMLQALSFFTMGNLWSKSPMVAILSYAAIKRLALFLLWLDLGELEQSWWDLFALVSFNLAPSILAVVLLLYELWIGPAGKSLMVALVFFSHAGWLWYLSTLFQNAGSKDGRFQPGNYANVLEWVRPDSVSSVEVCDYGEDGEETVYDVKPSATNVDAKGTPVVMNGGRTPGLWQGPRIKQQPKHTPPVSSDVWLPVKVLNLFTTTTVGWWLLSGVLHSMIIEFDQHNNFRHFTGDDVKAPLTPRLLQWSPIDGDVKPPLSPQLLQWPEPARLFKVAALLCDDSQIWVSSAFSLFAVSEESTQAPKTLSFVKDCDVGALICGPHDCDTLIPPSSGHGWRLSPLQSLSDASTPVPIPESWHLVAGSWLDCTEAGSASCSSAGLVGWDGAKLFAATLEKVGASSTWAVHSRFEVDPVLGLCNGGNNDCGQQVAHRYQDVRALQVGAGGGTLLVLSGAGSIDVWDLPKGVVRETISVGDGFTSMCLSRNKIFLSREEPRGPALLSMNLTTHLATLLQQPRSSARLAKLLQRSVSQKALANRAERKLTDTRRQNLRKKEEETLAAATERIERSAFLGRKVRASKRDNLRPSSKPGGTDRSYTK
jgi:hypothetical protein